VADARHTTARAGSREISSLRQGCSGKVERLACTRPERLNAVTAGVRQVNADLVFRADIDVVIVAERQQRCRRVICNRKKR